MTAAWIERWCATCRERRVVGDLACELVDELLQPRLRHDVVHQTDAQRLGGVDPPPREQDLGGLARPDQRHERRRGLVRIADAELGGRDAELRVVGADAEVGRERTTITPPPMQYPWISASTGLPTASMRRGGAGAAALRRGRADLARPELVDVGAGHEGSLAGAPHDHDPYFRIFGEGPGDPAQRGEHLAGHGIVLLGVVEHDRADPVDDGGAQLLTPAVHRPDGTNYA